MIIQNEFRNLLKFFSLLVELIKYCKRHQILFHKDKVSQSSIFKDTNGQKAY